MKESCVFAVVGSMLIVAGFAFAQCADQAEEKCVDTSASVPCGPALTNCPNPPWQDDVFCDSGGQSVKVVKVERSIASSWLVCRDLPGSPSYTCGESLQTCGVENWYTDVLCMDVCVVTIMRRCQADGDPSCPL